MRECSRKRPTTETTRMFSDTPGTPGAQAADAADVEVHPHARLRRLVERADAARVHERVHLHRRCAASSPGPVRLDRLADLVEEPVAHVVGRHDRLAVVGRARGAGERVEQLRHVGGDLAVAGEAGRSPRTGARSWRGSCRCRCARSGARPGPRGGRRAAPWRASSAPAGRGPRARPPLPARAPSRCCGARRSAPSARRGRPPACRARPPRSATGTSAESSEVRYTVILIASTSGSATACWTKRSTLRGERVVGVVDEQVAGAHRGEHVGACRRRARSSAGWVTGVQGGSRSSRRPVELVERPQVVEVEQAVDVDHLRLLDRRAARSGTRACRGSIDGDTSSRTTSPKRRRRSSSSTARSRSSASSETVKSASRVTRKKSWRRISMPGKSSSRWRAITASSGTNASVADRHEARQHLLRHLHPREGLVAASPGRAARRPATARGSRCTGTAGPGRPRAASAPGRSARRTVRSIASSSARVAAPRSPIDADAVLGERRPDALLPHARVARAELAGCARRCARSSPAATGRPARGRRCRRRPGRAGRPRAP